MSEIEIKKEELSEDKYDRLRLIPWWDQERLKKAKIMVVGAGALGNELIKDLALLGIGNIFIFDIDKIENTNLTRSVLFREGDIGLYKAEVAAQSAMGINPDIKAKGYTANIIDDVGLGFFRQCDLVLGGLDNREARLAINRACYKVNKIWIDGAIEALNGVARVFEPNNGACYECTMTNVDWQLINKRKSCALLTKEEMIEGKTPTTPTSSAIIAGIQVQEMLKILHRDRKLPNLIGKGFVFNGITHDSYVVEYQKKEECMSHDTYEKIIEKNWESDSISIIDVLNEIRSEQGMDTIIELDRDIVTHAECKCKNTKNIFKPIHKLKKVDLICEKCGETMNYESIHVIDGTEDFLNVTFSDIGIPSYHIIVGRNGMDIRYYEFSGDKFKYF